MSETQTRPLLPRISRGWDARTGRMVWVCDSLPAGRWGPVSHQARMHWHQAMRYCASENAKAAATDESRQA